MRGLAWWVAWIMVCLPAGALAGLALIEFNLGGGPYDGGFLGYLVLFGGFLALGQSPFLFYFSRALQQHYSDSSPEADTTLGAALGWVLTGFAGWTIGSVVSIGWPGVSAGIEPSVAYLSSRALPWLVMGLLQGGVHRLFNSFTSASSTAGRNCGVSTEGRTHTYAVSAIGRFAQTRDFRPSQVYAGVKSSMSKCTAPPLRVQHRSGQGGGHRAFFRRLWRVRAWLVGPRPPW